MSQSKSDRVGEYRQYRYHPDLFYHLEFVLLQKTELGGQAEIPDFFLYRLRCWNTGFRPGGPRKQSRNCCRRRARLLFIAAALTTIGIFTWAEQNTDNDRWADKAGVTPLWCDHFDRKTHELINSGAQYGQLPHCRHRTGRQQSVCFVEIRFK